jgi:hypothetical protein
MPPPKKPTHAPRAREPLLDALSGEDLVLNLDELITRE